MIRIAVDFDGTIVENAYPGIGKEQLFAFETLGNASKARLSSYSMDIPKRACAGRGG